MRSVAAVVALVACVHAGLWALSRDHISAPNYQGQLASVFTRRLRATNHPDLNSASSAEHIRADLKLLARLPRNPHLFGNRRASNWCQQLPMNLHARFTRAGSTRSKP